MVKGLTIGLVAMAFWGLIFVLPLFAPEFSSFEVSMGRFISYGLVSFLFLLFRGKLKSLPFAHWKLAIAFALTSSLIYYFFIVLGIRCLGASFATALCSLLPVFSAIYGNYRQKVFAWSVLILPLTLLTLGLVLMHYENLTISEGMTGYTMVAGGLFIILAQSMWVWYSVNNAQFQSAYQEISPSTWSSFIGIFCLVGGVLGMALMLFISPQSCYLTRASTSETFTYIGISFLNGFAASWLTLYLWNVASRYVPIAILGQLGVFEVLFGLSYIYLKNSSLPTLFEGLGIGLILSGLYFSLKRGAKAEMTLIES